MVWGGPPETNMFKTTSANHAGEHMDDDDDLPVFNMWISDNPVVNKKPNQTTKYYGIS